MRGAADKFDPNQGIAQQLLAHSIRKGLLPLKRASMRAPSERDQCQAKLDILVDGFMRDDSPAFREACDWLRNFADQKKIEDGRVMNGSNWYVPEKLESVREFRRMWALGRGGKSDST